jgi:hypothetical protein
MVDMLNVKIKKGTSPSKRYARKQHSNELCIPAPVVFIVNCSHLLKNGRACSLAKKFTFGKISKDVVRVGLIYSL